MKKCEREKKKYIKSFSLPGACFVIFKNLYARVKRRYEQQGNICGCTTKIMIILYKYLHKSERYTIQNDYFPKNYGFLLQQFVRKFLFFVSIRKNLTAGRNGSLQTLTIIFLIKVTILKRVMYICIFLYRLQRRRFFVYE